MTEAQITGQYSAEHIAAFKRWQREGSIALTESEVKAIEREDPETGTDVRKKRAEREAEIVGKVEAEAISAQRRITADAPAAARNLAGQTWAELNGLGLTKAEVYRGDFDWVHRAADKSPFMPAPICLVGWLLKFAEKVGEIAEATNEKNVASSRRRSRARPRGTPDRPSTRLGTQSRVVASLEKQGAIFTLQPDGHFLCDLNPIPGYELREGRADVAMHPGAARRDQRRTSRAEGSALRCARGASPLGDNARQATRNLVVRLVDRAT
jgi:hypothetical protein